MPTNLPPEARSKWIKVMEARTLEDKIAALEEFISSVPKHKGTENLMLWATRRLSQLREELEERKRKKVGRGPRFFIEKEGAAQLVILGEPNSGKTSLLVRLTNAKAEVSPTPYSTRSPIPGMMRFEDVLIQLVDTPSISFGNVEKVSWYSKTIGLVRNSDGVLLIIDLTRDVDRQMTSALDELEDNGIILGKRRGTVSFIRASGGGLNFVINGKITDASLDEVKKMLAEYKIHHGIIKVTGEVSIDDIEAAIFGNREYKPSILVGNKADIANRDSIEVFVDLAKKRDIPFVVTSAVRGDNLDVIPRLSFEVLQLIRVYTRQPSGKIAERPLVLKKGATVLDVAKAVHSSFVESFRYAKIWGPSAKYPGERVGKDHVLADKDIVEIKAF